MSSVSRVYRVSRANDPCSLDPSAADPGLSDVFAVSGRSLAVGPGAAGLNYEVVAVFSLSIQSQDDGAPPLSVNATVIVEVKDVNDPPTSVSLATGQVGVCP